MRHDALIIWGHGLADLDRILEMVRVHQGFRIRRILLRDIDDMPRFVRSVYNFDYAPYRHLIDKTRYLLSVPPRAAFIFLDNLQPEEHSVGTGRFAHTECAKMTALKRAIRDQFNPKVNGQPSDNHIVHGTDHVGQTLATLKLLGLQRIDELNHTQPTILKTPDHLPPRKQWTIKQIEMSKVYARISNKPGADLPHQVVPLDQTPHALYLAGEQEAYKDYWLTHRGNRLQEDHAPQAFDHLSEQLDYLGSSHPDSYLLLERLDDQRFVLLDGVHRASILRSRGVECVLAAVADEDSVLRNESARSPIDLSSVFDQTDSYDFAVMKSLPAGIPARGSDIDILCTDKASLGRQLLQNCQPLVAQGYELRLRELPETDQAHLDMMYSGRIALRLDLHEGLGAYQRTPVKETFAERLLDRRTWREIDSVSGTLSLPVPDAIDNLVLRYLEYHEWFDARPDKIKHAEHIADQIAQDTDQTSAFYQRLMQATSQRPHLPTLRYCDLNLKRQCIWAFWSIRDKLAWRLNSAKNILRMACTQPGVFVTKVAQRLTPIRSRTIQHKAN
ncbi:MAG: hypothetical protein ACPG4Q_08280 [Phycisphaeraceae bacterium]